MTQLDIPLDDRILTALEQNPHLPGRSLRFEMEQGKITLKGTVCSYYQKQMAQEALREFDGIAEIHNELEVVAICTGVTTEASTGSHP
jgi:osmotically-inducible protein OsmY